MKTTIKTLILLLVLAGCFFVVKPIAAQTETIVYFSPNPANVYINDSNEQVVNIRVDNAVNLYGFEFIITYDANLTQITNIAMGDLLDIDIDSLWCNGRANDPGYFRLVCNLHNPSQPVTGSGVVLTLTFAGVKNGDTALNFDLSRLIVRNDGVLSWFYPSSTNGTLNVTYNSTVKPTTLAGSFSLQAQGNRGGVPVTLSAGQFVHQGPYTQSTTNTTGNNLNFTNVAMDVYTVSTSQPGYLNISTSMNRQIALLASGNLLPELTLVAGNAVWTDNEINLGDFTLVAGQYGNTKDVATADINRDGKVDILDLVLVASNYGMTSESAYADWMAP